ncbi:hypothetical protein K488DRAFT_83736 [Vararia minispora EC-137]|uniref:Uncharacterized protein n=1 Tax=Vararia minispora EC-137 TaxID=1314806 RepID=A0ACB8QSS9_9AGAM|nr:hypothetical protein K488DRAFT_83736 [Vararia minispora EC-137]
MSSNPPPAQQPGPPNAVPSFFNTGASPPLIIGFIAIGAFTFGIVVLAIWRRTHSQRLIQTTRPSRVEALKKPHLHEAWIGGESTVDAELRWAEVMPLAAKIERVTAEKRRWFLRGHVAGGELGDNSQDEHRDDAMIEHEGTLEITVLLAMPSPRGEKREKAGVTVELGADDEMDAKYNIELRSCSLSWKDAG